MPDETPEARQARVTAIPIATADRSKSGYAFVRDPRKLAEVTIALVYEKKIEAPAVVVLTDTELLIVGVAGLMGLGPEAYEQKLAEIVAQHKSWATIQVVFAVLKSGDAPVMHLRCEVLALDGYKDYGVVIFGWAQKSNGGVAVMAHPDRDYSIATPFLLRPKLVIPPAES